MLTRLNHQSIAFKLSLFVIFSALFFVQLQVRFIEYAYDGSSRTEQSVHFTEHSSGKVRLNAATTDSGTTYLKLNKRYPVNNVFTLSAASPVIKPVFTPLLPPFFYTEPFLADNSYSIFFLRGPPAAM